eukprot:jgi/Tetstr1/430562/TSEL_020360.t1
MSLILNDTVKAGHTTDVASRAETDERRSIAEITFYNCCPGRTPAACSCGGLKTTQNGPRADFASHAVAPLRRMHDQHGDGQRELRDRRGEEHTSRETATAAGSNSDNMEEDPRASMKVYWLPHPRRRWSLVIFEGGASHRTAGRQDHRDHRRDPGARHMAAPYLLSPDVANNTMG